MPHNYAAWQRDNTARHAARIEIKSKGGFTILTQGLALRCVKFAISENIMFFVKIFDQTHERTAREHKDRIRVYPSVLMRCDQRQRTTDATQRKALRRIVYPP